MTETRGLAVSAATEARKNGGQGQRSAKDASRGIEAT